MNDYERIARVLRYLDENHTDQPDLTTLARHVVVIQNYGGSVCEDVLEWTD
jgi:hypothetical protein